VAEIREFLFVRHLRAETTSYVLRYKRGRLIQGGRALGFWFMPMSSSVAEVPVDDQELSFLFHLRSADFQDTTVQGAVAYRVLEPEKLAERVDFSIDLRRGRWLKQPLETLAQLVTQLAQQLAVSWVSAHELRTVLGTGPTLLRERIEAGLASDAGLSQIGLSVTTVRIASVAPTPELERALEAPMRERFQQEADEAGFQRRAQAVEKERAIQENELQNQIELSRREEQLIRQRGVNDQRRVEDEAESARIEMAGRLQRLSQETQAKAELDRIEGQAESERDALRARTKAEATRAVQGAEVELEAARMAIYAPLPQHVLLGLAAQELARKLQSIEHVRIEPDTLQNLLAGLAPLRAAGPSR
jgi:regulator of protease activity HflC (stomatin/prohibitin superfamily)